MSIELKKIRNAFEIKEAGTDRVLVTELTARSGFSNGIEGVYLLSATNEVLSATYSHEDWQLIDDSELPTRTITFDSNDALIAALHDFGAVLGPIQPGLPALISPDGSIFDVTVSNTGTLTAVRRIASGELVYRAAFASDMGENSDANHRINVNGIMASNPPEIWHGGDTYPSGAPVDAIANYSDFKTYIDQQKWFHIGGDHDMDFVRTITDVAADVGTTLFDKNSVWKTFSLPTGQPFPIGWQDLDFDDAGWLATPGIHGYGDGFVDTQLDFGGDPSAKYASYLFRKIIDGATITSNGVLAEVCVDDGCAIVINGVEVFSLHMPYPITEDNFAINVMSSNASGRNTFREGADTIVRIPAHYFNPTGQNVIAVIVKQVSGSSSDLSFGMSLKNYTFPSIGTFGSLPFLQHGSGDGIRDIAPYLPDNTDLYTRRVGNVEAFFLSSRINNDEIEAHPYSVGANSKQADWLRTAVTASDATFKFVITHETIVSYTSNGYRSYLDWIYTDPALSSLTGLIHGDQHISALTKQVGREFYVIDASNFRNTSRRLQAMQATTVRDWESIFIDNTDRENLFLKLLSNETACTLAWTDVDGVVKFERTIFKNT